MGSTLSRGNKLFLFPRFCKNTKHCCTVRGAEYLDSRSNSRTLGRNMQWGAYSPCYARKDMKLPKTFRHRAKKVMDDKKERKDGINLIQMYTNFE